MLRLNMGSFMLSAFAVGASGSWTPCNSGSASCCDPTQTNPVQLCPSGAQCQECGGGTSCECASGASPTPTPFTDLGCPSAIPLDGSSIWQGSSGRWNSCDQDVRSDGMKKCVRADGQVDETSVFFDMSALASKGGCFVWESSSCGTDMTKVSRIEFDFDFSSCQDVWTAPLWITPEVWVAPGGTSGEIDFIEMCPVGKASTNFGAGGQNGEAQVTWGSGSGANGPKHFTLTLDGNGNLKTRICNLDGTTGCFDGAHYENFLNVITSKNNHHFVTDVWNGNAGDGGWYGCGGYHNENTQCKYAIMNLRVYTKDGQPLYSGTCAAITVALPAVEAAFSIAL